jgi:hypothetical protein
VADTVLLGGKILTVDARNTSAEALAIAGSRLLQLVSSFRPHPVPVFVCPGFFSGF